MFALTQIFSFLYVYVRIFIAYIFGSKVYLDSFDGVAFDFAKIVFDSLGCSKYIVFDGQPILILIVGVFVLGALIGLIHRLMK